MNPEFTTAIRAAKLIRVCAALMKPDRGRFHRLTKFILHHVIHADTTHKQRERQILIQNLKVFEGYEFNPDFPLSTYMPANIILSMQHKITLSIPFPQLIWPEHTSFCKIMLLGVAVNFQTFSTASEIKSTDWIAISDLPAPPVYIEVNNNHPLFIVVGMAYTNNKDEVITCQAVKIIAINS